MAGKVTILGVYLLTMGFLLAIVVVSWIRVGIGFVWFGPF